MTKQHIQQAHDLISFINRSPSPYHAAADQDAMIRIMKRFFS